MSRDKFEAFIKSSPSYQVLIFSHGERLFIFDYGQYRVLAIRIAYEVWCRD